MMYQKLLCIALLFAASSAHAWDCSVPANRHLNVPGNECYVAPKPHRAPPTTVLQQSQNQGQSQNATSSSSSNAASRANSLSSSVSEGGNATAAGGSAVSSAKGGAGGSAGADSSSGGNSYSSTESIPRDTPPAFAGSVQPTASCKNARNGGASAPVAGISFGWSTSDDECDLRETAREFYEMGQRETAVALLCQSKMAKRLPACAYAPPVAVVPVAAVDDSEGRVYHPLPGDEPVTQKQLQEIERRMLARGVGK